MKGHKIIKDAEGNKDLDISSCVFDSEVVRNNIEARCSIIRGELPYNTILGIPLKSSKEELDLTILNIVNNTLGVKEVNKYISTEIDRVYKASIEVITRFSNITVEVQNGNSSHQ